MSVDRIDRLASRRHRARPSAPKLPKPQIPDARPGPDGDFAPLLLALAMLVFLFAPTAQLSAPETATETQIAAPLTPKASNLLVGLPSRFEPNVGQVGYGIAYTLKVRGYLASLSPNAIYFALPEGKGPENQEDRIRDPEADPLSREGSCHRGIP